MHLERVTTRSSEAGIAGWIASNDVTLFTMVLVMVIAIFLHTKLNKGVLEQERLIDQNTTVSATLAATEEQLGETRELLGRTEERLNLSQAERDALQKQLVEKLAALTALNAKLDALVADKGELNHQRETLLA
jgi:septal ring factor EnvC (AmiA/AmiB activator)